jgi:hypothetical protein
MTANTYQTTISPARIAATGMILSLVRSMPA